MSRNLAWRTGWVARPSLGGEPRRKKTLGDMGVVVHDVQGMFYCQQYLTRLLLSGCMNVPVDIFKANLRVCL